MAAYQQVVLLLVCCAAAYGLGADLKSIFSSFSKSCSENQVTCEANSGITCCDIALGVCCENGKTCCPYGFDCDMENDVCVSNDGETAQHVTLPPRHNKFNQESLRSNNASCTKKKCDGDQTCCHDDWDCCPVPEAVCCKDKGHCCPHGYICDDQPFICRWPDDKHSVHTITFKRVEEVEIVTCDDSHTCPNGNTCCKMPNGSWGCCPVADAVCCGDHIHCCSKGSTCDVEHGKCTSKSGLLFPWFTKQLAVKSTQPTEVMCDSAHYCPDGNTCCKLPSDEWGCCPVPNAVCCADQQHCCPSGYTCQTGTGECTRGLTSMPWIEKESALVKPVSVENVMCDSTHYCPNGNTCCRLSSGEWGCCPVPNAVCCADHEHCCPSGYTCQTGSGKCIRGLTSIPWIEKESALVKPVSVENVMCDSTHYCPNGNTCCRLSSGGWGCCPVPNAVCCADQQHCCPSGYTCQTGSGICVKGLTSIPWIEKESALVKPVSVENVMCDSTHYCPDGNTCCRLSSGGWGCCPVPNAVCCADQQHCCPSGYTCQTGSGKCVRGLTSVPWIEKESALVKPVSVENVMCDSTHYCPDGNTCCRLSSGGWGCCPVPNAVCCADQQHCCPSGYTCQTGSGKCVRGLISVPWIEKDSALVKPVSVENVMCDSTHYCPDGNTCCKLSSGGWGCCPVPNAVCCADHEHCCPSGYTCQTGSGKCVRGLISVPWIEKESALVKPVSVENVMCDSTHYCPDGNTCCRLSSGGWGCCPVPNAVCCADQQHCCPSGYTCQTGSGKCVRGLISVPWIEKDSALVKPVSVENVMCDSTHYCPNGNTCCRLSSGGWGCCPVPNAVCCADHEHCCPSGYTCQTGSGICVKGLTSIPWIEKESALVKPVSVENVMCDSTHYCPDGNTCCKLSSGGWGCCPVPNAVCCADHEHCCPSGYTCQTGSGKCVRGLISVPWIEKESALVKPVSVENVMCDSTHYCPDGNTCCRLSSGGWGCCPVPNAVCCADQQHCCPSGYTCQTGSGKCVRGLISVPWIEKDSALVKPVSVENVMCDSTHYCPNGNTCCRLSSGGWGCCPVPNAVCCADQQHCCPSGYTCQTGSGKCVRGLTSIPWIEKESALVKPVSVEDVQCDSTHYCPNGNTCCKLSSGGWGCCPILNAVCCDDQHCCPSGYTCQTGTGECVRGNQVISWLKKKPAVEQPAPAQKTTSVRCDDQYECPDNYTCCRMFGGDWGCCPYQRAVCCSDGQHCCPNGYTCDSVANKCYKGEDVSADLFIELAAARGNE